MQYETLNDVAEMYPRLSNLFRQGNTEIWYANRNYGRDARMGYDFLKQNNLLPDPDNLEDTHVKVGEISADVEEVFGIMQGEVWSPEGEARQLIQRLGLQSTSMSVGDVIKRGNEVYIIDRFGKKRIDEGLERFYSTNNREMFREMFRQNKNSFADKEKNEHQKYLDEGAPDGYIYSDDQQTYTRDKRKMFEGLFKVGMTGQNSLKQERSKKLISEGKKIIEAREFGIPDIKLPKNPSNSQIDRMIDTLVDNYSEQQLQQFLSDVKGRLSRGNDPDHLIDKMEVLIDILEMAIDDANDDLFMRF